MFFIVSISILSSYTSVNYFISNYIHSLYNTNISHNIDLINKKISDDLQNKILLAENLNFGLMDISETKEKSGFYRIIQVSDGFAFSDADNLTEEQENLYIKLAEEQQGLEPTISQVSTEDNKLFLTITLKHPDDLVNFFILELNNISEMVTSFGFEGSYIELTSENNTIIYSDKKSEDMTPITKKVKLNNRTWQLNGYIDQDLIQESTSTLNSSITFYLLITAIFIIIISTIILHFLLKPLLHLKEVVEDLSEGSGDLTQRLNVNTNDEIGKISNSINLFIEKLQSMFIDVNRSSLHIENSISLLNEHSKSNGETVNKHNTGTALVTESINEMRSTADSIADSAIDAAKLTKQTSDIAENSKGLVKQAELSVETLVNEVDITSKSVNTMSQDTQEISKVLNVIGEIADQTNLLALNAAIEAARSGVHGRGFAVVADEVRSLASRTQDSTTKISNMLIKLNSATKNVVISMDSTRESCANTARNTNNVMDSLHKVTDSVIEINQLITKVADSASQQSNVTEALSKNMDDIQRIVCQLNENSVKTGVINDELRSTSTDLHNVVGRFKIS